MITTILRQAPIPRDQPSYLIVDRILDRPFREVLELGAPEIGFCLAWANQSWTGIWHAAADKVLRQQTYPGDDDDRRHFEAIQFRTPGLSSTRATIV